MENNQCSILKCDGFRIFPNKTTIIIIIERKISISKKDKKSCVIFNYCNFLSSSFSSNFFN